MTPKTNILTFRPDDDIHAAMAALRERDGVPFSEQIRRALRVWLETKGVMGKAERTRAGTRKRS